VKAIGIDVAPAKGGHVCENGSPPREMKPADLDCYLQGLPDNVLVAWDAPLTGPPDPGAWTDCRDLTTRQIERFFGQPGRFRVPKGISVRSYCGCPHWTISRRLLGLPRVGRFDVEADLPFRLVTDNRDRPSTGRHVVEVHPAVALWLWCRTDYHGEWQYKKDEKCRRKLSRLMSYRIGKDLANVSDDELDAWTAWYLARCWLDSDDVMLLGNAKTGSFLLPDEPDLQTMFEQFLSRQKSGSVC
jgi:Protein of unknown function (DUF429)